METISVRSAIAPRSTSESDSKVFQAQQYLTVRRMSMRIDAMCVQAIDDAIDDAGDVSQSLGNRRHRPSQANVGSATHRRGSSSKPFAVSDRLMILGDPLPMRARTSLSLSPT